MYVQVSNVCHFINTEESIMPKINGQKRSERIIIRVRPEEKIRIENLAKANLKSPSDYIREKSLSDRTPKEIESEIKKAVEERIELIQQKMQLEYNLTFEAEYQRRVGSLNWWKLWNDWREYSKKTISQKLIK